MERENWKSGLHMKGANRFLRVHPELKPNVMYTLLRGNLRLRDSFTLLVKLLTIKEQDEDTLCTLCGNITNDAVEHMFMRCYGLLDERSDLWTSLLDDIDINAEVDIMQMDDEHALDVLLGAKWTYLVDIGTTVSFYKTVGHYVNTMTTRMGIV